MKIILLNGAPRSGKDTSAQILIDAILNNDAGFPIHEKFSLPIKQAFASVTSTYFDEDTFENESWEHRKEEVVYALGVSYRQWQIDFSEKFMKPLYGQDIFARIFLDRIFGITESDDKPVIIIVSDCGFQIEYDTVATRFGSSVSLLQLHREGTSFAGDSRQLVVAPNAIPIYNGRLGEPGGTSLLNLKSQLHGFLSDSGIIP